MEGEPETWSFGVDLDREGVKGGPLLCEFSLVRSVTGSENPDLRKATHLPSLLKGLSPDFLHIPHPTCKLQPNPPSPMINLASGPLYPCKTGIQEGQAAPSISGLSSHPGSELEVGLKGGWGLLWVLRSLFFNLPDESVLQIQGWAFSGSFAQPRTESLLCR